MGITFSMEMTPVVLTPIGVTMTTSLATSSKDDVTDKIMDDMISSFFDSLSVSNSPFDTNVYFEKIVNHGRSLLQQEHQDPNRERLARRLTSIHSPTWYTSKQGIEISAP